MPSPVDKYVKQIREQNPDYDDAKVWATAWSIYCKYKNPRSDSCHKPTGDYLKGKKAMSDKEAREFSSPEALEKYLKAHPGADKSKHTVKKDDGGGSKKQPEKKVTPHSMRDKAEEHTKAGKHDEAALAYAAAAQRFREEGMGAAAKSMDDAARESAKKHQKAQKKKKSAAELVDFQDALLTRNVVARTVAARRGKFVDLDALDTAIAGIKQGMEAWDTREDDNTERAIKKWAKDYNKLVEKAQKALARSLKENSKEWHTSADLLNAIDVIDEDKILRLTAGEVSKKLDKAMTAWKEIDQLLGGQKVLFAHGVES